MAVSDQLVSAFGNLVNKTGKPIRVRYFSQTVGSVWDDEVTLTKSGADLWTSGIVLQLDLSRGSSERILVEQGKLLANDLRLYTNGSLNLTFIGGSNLSVKIQLGSPTGNEFALTGNGAIRHEVNGTTIHQKVYLTRITNGSLIGE